MRRLAVLVVLAALVLSASVPAATGCADRILRDWSTDGRVASSYSLPCYQEAIDALPADLRDYTNAEEVISRALASAVRGDEPGHVAANSASVVGSADPASRSTRVALAFLVGLALVVLVAGGAGYVALRLRGSTDHVDE